MNPDFIEISASIRVNFIVHGFTDFPTVNETTYGANPNNSNF